MNSKELDGDLYESLRQIVKIINIISHLRTFYRSEVIPFSSVKMPLVIDDTITCESDIGKGTVFEIKLPIKSDDPASH